MRATLLNRIVASKSLLNETQLAFDATLNHFTEEATNPASLISMTLGSLAFQGTRTALLGLGVIRNPLTRNVLSYAGAFATEVSVIRTSNHLFSGNSSPLLQTVFNRQSWGGTAIDIGFLKLAGFAGSHQNIFLRHALQDVSMVTAHDLGAQLGWAPKESGSFIQKLFHAEVTNWTLMAGSSLGHLFTGGRLAHLERSLALQAEAQSFSPRDYGHIEPRFHLPRMAAPADNVEIPEDIRERLTTVPLETPRAWAERLLRFTAENPETHALYAVSQLYERLRQPENRAAVLETLLHMKELTRDIPEGQNLLVRRYRVEGIDHPIPLVSLPSTFLPEAWSQTFVTGIAKDHQTNPQERNLAIEVGSGTGFVSIAMAKLGVAKRIIATDLNHHAGMLGKLNAALNGVEDLIEFQKGDLLTDIPHGTPADLIVGCLPQMPSKRAEGEVALRDLADYAGERGVFEDQLGLGLNATVLEQATTRLSSNGKIRLMMAQRPGLNAVRDLFRVRGFSPRIIHSTFIQQDPTTDFDALAEIETGRGFPFEFRTSDRVKLSASDALQLPRDQVFHDLHLVEGTPYTQLMQRSLTSLSREESPWGYTEDPGTESPILLERAHAYLEGYWGTKIDPRTLFIAPSHAALLDNALRLTLEKSDPIVVVGNMDPATEQVLRRNGWNGERLPENLAELANNIERNSAKAIVFRLPRQIARHREDLERIVSTAIHKNIFMVFIEHEGGVVDCEGRVLADVLAKYSQAAAQTMIIHPLETLFHLPTLPLAVGIIPDTNLHSTMVHMGDVTYSRASSLVQAAYASFLDQAEIRGRITVPRSQPKQLAREHWLRLHENPLRERLQRAPIFTTSPQSSHPDPIDMSFGESEWRAAIPLASAYNTALQAAPLDTLRSSLSVHLGNERGVSVTPDSLLLGYGVHPLIQASIRGIRAQHPEETVEVVIPDPSYGMFEPTVWAAGAQARHILTRSGRNYLLEVEKFRATPKAPNTRRVLLLNIPTNPAGQYYPPALIADLAKEVDYLLLDEVFAGTTFQYPWRTPAFRDRTLQDKVVTFGGLAKEMGMGGVRLGYAHTSNPHLREAIAQENILDPDPIATQLALDAFAKWDDLLPTHQEYLRNRARRLEDFFQRHQTDYHAAQGGFSMFVNLGHLLDGRHTFQGIRLTSQNFHEVLMQHAGIKIKSDQWAQMPGHYRFVFSIERLEEAVRRLEEFWTRIEGP